MADPKDTKKVTTGTAVIEQPPVKPSITPMKFELLDGQHAGYDKNGCMRLWRKGEIVECYRVNIEAEVRDDKNRLISAEKAVPHKAFDLAKRFNQGSDAMKFRPVPVDVPSSKGLKLVEGNPVMDDDQLAEYEKAGEVQAERRQSGEDAFEVMTMEELKQYAAENEVEISGMESREALLRAIRQNEDLAHPLNR